MSTLRNTHFEAVGSYLRPAALKEARARFAAGEISTETLREVEDREIADVVAKQKACGLHYITDGEFRRSYWHLDFMWGLNGVEHIELDHGYQFHGEETTHGSLRLTGRISGENHPFIQDFLYVKQFEEDGVEAKLTIPAPHSFWPSCFVATTPATRASIIPTPKNSYRISPLPIAPFSMRCMRPVAVPFSSTIARGA